MVAEIVIALAIFFIGLPLACMALGALLRAWPLILLMGVFALAIMVGQDTRRPTQGSLFNPHDEVVAENLAEWEKLQGVKP